MYRKLHDFHKVTRGQPVSLPSFLRWSDQFAVAESCSEVTTTLWENTTTPWCQFDWKRDELTDRAAAASGVVRGWSRTRMYLATGEVTENPGGSVTEKPLRFLFMSSNPSKGHVVPARSLLLSSIHDRSGS